MVLTTNLVGQQTRDRLVRKVCCPFRDSRSLPSSKLDRKKIGPCEWEWS